MVEIIKRFALKMGYVIKRSSSHSSGSNFIEDLGKLTARENVLNIVDVGANIGQTSRRFRVEFPASRIYSFEPVKSTFDTLKNSFNSDPLITCFNLALGDQKKQAEIYKSENSELNSLRRTKNADEEHSIEIVQIETLDEVCSREGIVTIDILKSDTEGFDLEVLKGGENLFRHGKIKAVVTEATFNSDDLAHTNFFKLAEFLSCHGFLIMSIYEAIFIPGSGRMSHFNVAFIHTSLKDALSGLEHGQ